MMGIKNYFKEFFQMGRSHKFLVALVLILSSGYLMGARTYLQTWQMVQDSAMSVLGIDSRTDLQTIFVAVDKELDVPFRLSATSPVADAKLNIGANQIEKGDGSMQTTAPSDDQINPYVATTIDYQTGAITGGTVETEGVAFTKPSCTVGQFRRHFLVYVSADNKINSKFSDESVTVGGLENPGSIASALDGTPVGYLDLECSNASGQYKTAGSASNFIENKVSSDPRIFRFGSGAGGGAGEVQDFKIQAITDPDATIKKGFVMLGNDGRILSTYDGAGTASTDFNVDLVIDLDNVLGGVAQGGSAASPVDASTYQLVIDMDECCNDDAKAITTTDTNRKLFPIQEEDFRLLLGENDSVDGGRYVRVGEVKSATTGNVWSGTGSSFNTTPFRVHPEPSLLQSPVVYEMPEQSIGTVGSVENDYGALVDGDFPTPASSVGFDFNSSSAKTSGTGTASFTDVNSPTYTSKGFFGHENILTLDGVDQNLSSTDALFDSSTFTFGGWVKSNSYNETGPFTMFSSGMQSDLFGAYMHLASGNLTCYIGYSSGRSGATTSLSNFKDGEWHHLACAYNDATKLIELYVDGVMVYDVVAGGNVVYGAADSYIGTTGGAARFWDGNIAQFFYASEVLTSAQINHIYSKRFKGKQIAAGHILTNDSFPFDSLTGKVSYWNLDSLSDGSGNDKTFTANGSMTSGSASGLFGNPTEATLFDGVDDFLSSADPYFDFTTEFNLSGWFKLDDWSPTGNMELFSKFFSTGNLRAFNFDIDGGNTNTVFRVNLYSDGINSDIFGDLTFYSTDFVDGSYHHLSLDFKAGSHVKLYVDGIEVASGVASNNALFDSSIDFMVGGYGNATNFLKGSLDEFHASNKSLTPEDIFKLYSARIDLPVGMRQVTNENQLWSSNFQREDSQINNDMSQDWLVDKTDTAHAQSLYVNFGLNSGDRVAAKLQDISSLNSQATVQRVWSTGVRMVVPTFPMNHSLGVVPMGCVIQHESHTVSGKWTNLNCQDYCDFDETEVDCNIGFPVDSTHKMRVVLGTGFNPVTDEPTDTLGALSNDVRSVGTVGSIANAQGALVDGDFPTPANVHYYHLNGDSNDDSGNTAVNLTQNGTPSFSGKGLFGRESVIDFDGIDDWLTTADTFFDFSNESVSMGGFFTPSDWGGTSQILIGKYNGVGNQRSYLLQLSGGAIAFIVSSNGTAVAQTSVNTSSLSGTHHVAASFDSAGQKINVYIDGKLSSTIAAGFSTLFNSSATFYIGSNGATGLLKDTFQDAFIYKGLLTDAEINHIASKRFTNSPQIAGGHILDADSFPYESLIGKVSYWNLNDVNDDSGSLNCTGGTTACTLTNNGSVTFDGLDIFGASRIAEFDGTSGKYLSSSDSYFDFSNQMSVGGWFAFNEQINAHTLFARYVSSNNSFMLRFSPTTNDLQFFVSDNGTVSDTIQTKVYPINGDMHHYAATFNNGVSKIYVDGELLVTYTSAFTNLFAGTADFSIGARETGGVTNILDGRAQDTFASNIVLSASDIKKLASARMDHNLDFQTLDDKVWSAFWLREDNQMGIPLDNGWAIDLYHKDKAYVDFSDLGAGSQVKFSVK